MKYLNHNFDDEYSVTCYGIVTSIQTCIYCNRSGQELYDSIETNTAAINEFKLTKENNTRSHKTDCEIYDKYIPCLTEEEYIIKNIIE